MEYPGFLKACEIDFKPEYLFEPLKHYAPLELGSLVFLILMTSGTTGAKTQIINGFNSLQLTLGTADA